MLSVENPELHTLSSRFVTSFKSKLYRRVIRNFSVIFSANGAILALGILTVSINTRALGLSSFGTLIVIQSLSELFNRIASVQTWQAINAFGAPAVQRGDYWTLAKLHRFAFLLDCGGALLGSLSAVFAVLFFADILKLPPEAQSVALFYAASAVLLGSSASQGVMRLLDYFGLAMAIKVGGAVLLTLNALLLWATEQAFWIYVVSIAAISALSPLTTNLVAYFLIRKQINVTDEATTAIDLWRFFKFALAISGGGTLNVLRQRSEVLVISAVLGPAAAGLYGVAFRLANLVNRFSSAGQQSVYPELAKLIAADDRARASSLVLKTIGIGAVVGCCAILTIALTGEAILETLFGVEFGSASAPLLWLTVSTLTFTSLFAAIPYVQLTHGANRYFLINLMAIVPFGLGVVLGPRIWGLAGAGLGAVAFAITLAVLVALHFVAVPPNIAVAADRVAR